MDKKELTPAEKIKKYGRDIMGVGIIYFVLMLIVVVASIKELLANPVGLIMNIGILVTLLIMVIGVGKRKRYGIIAGWTFEVVMVLSSIISILGNAGGPDLIALIVMIGLPFEFVSFSKALKESE